MFFSFLTVGAIVASFGFSPSDHANDANYDSYSLEQIATVAQVIDPLFNVSGFENKMLVSIEESDSKAMLYDFNGSEGYMLLGDDYKIFDFKAGVDLTSEAKQSNHLLFNNISKTYKSVQISGSFDINIFDEKINTNENIKNKSSNDKGEGKIESYELDNYVTNNFSGGVIDSYYSVPMNRYSQDDLSIYDCNGYTEGNCWLCASYTGLSHLLFDSDYSSSLYSNFSSKKNTLTYYPKSEELNTYNYAKSLNYTPYENISGSYKAKKVSFLYKNLRNKAISYDYKSPFDGFSTDNTIKTINDVMKKYGCSIRASKDANYNAYTGTESFKDYFRAGKVALFATNGGSYNQHVLAVCGYKHYRREKQFLWWSYTEWRTFLEVGDGHSKNVRYFDITRYFQSCYSGEFINFNL